MYQGHTAALLALLLLAPLVVAYAELGIHPLIDANSIRHGIKASRMEVQMALADPAAAFESFLTKFAAVAAPRGHTQAGGPQDSKSKAERLQVFTTNLQRAAQLNNAVGDQLLAYGITPFMHLTQEEFEVGYLGQTAASKAAAEAEAQVLELWKAAAGPEAVSRKLLARTQAPRAPTPEQQQASQPAATGGAAASWNQPLNSNSNISDIELNDFFAEGSASGTHAVPPAQLLPAQGNAAGPHMGLPSLPYNPEPGAAGCTAERKYPHAHIVPPADGVNWVRAGATTQVKDQGMCGSCVAFATTALAEFMHMKKYGTTNHTTDLSEQDLMDCTMGDGCGGQYQTAYVNVIGCSGVALEQDGPYRAADVGDSCRPVRRYSGMARGRGGGWAFVPNSSDGIAQAVSTAPVMVTLDATHWALYSGGVLDCNAPGTTTNHAVAVVGYVNRVEQPNGELWDVFIVRNSFGSWWGSGNGPEYSGHILLRKGCLGAGASGMQLVEGIVPLYG